jgi:hypothetical protein
MKLTETDCCEDCVSNDWLSFFSMLFSFSAFVESVGSVSSSPSTRVKGIEGLLEMATSLSMKIKY